MVHKKVDEMKESIMEYISLVNKMLDQTINGSVNHEWDKIKEVIDVLEPEANDFKTEIGQEGLGILARFQPEATQLRMIVKMLGMATDLERIGDLATKIALATYHWQDMFTLQEYPRIVEMAKEAHKMLEDVTKAFKEENSLAAVAVIQYDDRVDELCTRNIKQLIKEMNESDKVDHLLQIMNTVRNIERIADICTHFAEDIIFIKDGLIPGK